MLGFGHKSPSVVGIGDGGLLASPWAALLLAGDLSSSSHGLLEYSDTALALHRVTGGGN